MAPTFDQRRDALGLGALATLNDRSREIFKRIVDAYLITANLSGRGNCRGFCP